MFKEVARTTDQGQVVDGAPSGLKPPALPSDAPSSPPPSDHDILTFADEQLRQLTQSEAEPATPPTRPDDLATASWSVTMHRGIQGLEDIQTEWSALVAQPGHTYIQHPAWFKSYLTELSPAPDAMTFVVARCGKSLRAVLPIEPSGGFRHRLTPTWRLVQGPHMILSDIVASPGDVASWAVLCEWLRNEKRLRWTTLRLSSFAEDSVLHPHLGRGTPLPMLETERPFTAWMDCSQGLESCLAATSKSFKQNVKRLGRRADGLGRVNHEMVTSLHRLDWALDEFLTVEGSGWKTQAGTDIAHDGRLVRFYRSLAHAFGRTGQCRIFLLSLDGQTIAAQFGLVSNRQLNLLKIGYSADHAHIAPGHLIMQRTIEVVCADPTLDRLSFVTHPAWSHLWKPQLTAVREVALFHPGLTGRTLHAATRLWRSRRQRKGQIQASP